MWKYFWLKKDIGDQSLEIQGATVYCLYYALYIKPGYLNNAKKRLITVQMYSTQSFSSGCFTEHISGNSFFILQAISLYRSTGRGCFNYGEMQKRHSKITAWGAPLLDPLSGMYPWVFPQGSRVSSEAAMLPFILFPFCPSLLILALFPILIIPRSLS